MTEDIHQLYHNRLWSCVRHHVECYEALAKCRGGDVGLQFVVYYDGTEIEEVRPSPRVIKVARRNGTKPCAMNG